MLRSGSGSSLPCPCPGAVCSFFSGDPFSVVFNLASVLEMNRSFVDKVLLRAMAASGPGFSG